ncbi:glycosyltransferase family 2 protein [Vibrio hyugaensis]|uniref:glycosyltransferase family 2 protein n=1 Tax=Vibrio hyugaensis TaxID=1534743 RepID=UPI000694FE58|nr:glycosyltransferase family 2 protein [Vibrio hyugaensis]
MIDVILATYNGEKYIKEQLDSYISQSFNLDFIRFIICDDDSNDNTVDVVTNFLNNNGLNGNVYFRRESGDYFEHNSPACANFSFGLSKSESEYVMFSDQDDVWLDDKIEKTFSRMKELEDAYGKETPLLVFTDLIVVDSELNSIAKSFFKYQSMNPCWSEKLSQLVVQNIAPGCTVMVNRALLDLASPIPRQAVMHDWWLMLVASAFGKISCVDQPTIMYRQHENNQVGAKKLNFNQLLKSFNVGCSNLLDTSIQAKVFIDRYEKDLQETLGDYEFDKIQSFSTFYQKSYIHNLSGFFKAKYRKNNTLRNLGLLAAIHWKALK